MSEREDVEALLAEHVIDRDGLVWRLVHDGGMATRAHYAGIVSIGINTLEREHGPLVTLAAHDVRVRADERKRLAGVEALAEQWNATPDYAPTEYDQGRVDQRHDMTMQLLERLAGSGVRLTEEE